MKVLVYLFAAALALAAQSCNDNYHAKNYNAKTMVDQAAIQFIRNGLEGGMTEIKASTIAEGASQNPRVISFAKMMIADHTRAGNQLKNIESDKLVDKVDTLSLEHQQMLNGLSKKTGADFDKAYMQMMVDDHKKAVLLFTDASQNKSAAVSGFAQQTLPTIKMHLDSAIAINSSLK